MTDQKCNAIQRRLFRVLHSSISWGWCFWVKKMSRVIFPEALQERLAEQCVAHDFQSAHATIRENKVGVDIAIAHKSLSNAIQTNDTTTLTWLQEELGPLQLGDIPPCVRLSIMECIRARHAEAFAWVCNSLGAATHAVLHDIMLGYGREAKFDDLDWCFEHGWQFGKLETFLANSRVEIDNPDHANGFIQWLFDLIKDDHHSQWGVMRFVRRFAMETKTLACAQALIDTCGPHIEPTVLHIWEDRPWVGQLRTNDLDPLTKSSTKQK